MIAMTIGMIGQLTSKELCPVKGDGDKECQSCQRVEDDGSPWPEGGAKGGIALGPGVITAGGVAASGVQGERGRTGGRTRRGLVGR